MKFRDFRHSLAYVASLTCFAHLSVYAQSVQDPYTTRLDDVTITARSLENTGLLVPAQQLSGAALTQRL